MTYDLLFFGVFCLLVISYLVWDIANRTTDGKRELRDHQLYELKRKKLEDLE